MPTIANLNVKADGSFEGTLATLIVTAQIAIVPNGRKAKDNEPIINTDRRTYHVELRATAAAYMASVSWTYPADELIALQLAEAEAARVAPVAGASDRREQIGAASGRGREGYDLKMSVVGGSKKQKI